MFFQKRNIPLSQMGGGGGREEPEAVGSPSGSGGCPSPERRGRQTTHTDVHPGPAGTAVGYLPQGCCQPWLGGSYGCCPSLEHPQSLLSSPSCPSSPSTEPCTQDLFQKRGPSLPRAQAMDVPPAIWLRSFLLLRILQGWGQPTPHPLPWLLVNWVLWVVQARQRTWAVVVLADAHSPGGPPPPCLGEQGPLCLPARPHCLTPITAPGVWGWGPSARDACLHGNCCQGSILTLNSLS